MSKKKISSTINQRFEKLINEFFGGNKSEFSRTIGVRPSVIGNMLGERKGNPSFDVIQKVIDTIVSVSPDWLLTGKGSMLRQPDAEFGANKGARQDDEEYKDKYFALLEENRVLHNKYEALLEQKKGSAAIQGGAAGVKVG
jgi:hypothetical protein